MEIERVSLTSRSVLGLRELVKPEAMTEFFGRAFAAASAGLQQLGAQPAGPPVGVYRGDPERGFDVIAGFPVAGAVAPPPGLEAVQLPGGEAVATIHVGSYDSMETTYAALGAWMKEHDLTPGELMWEEYLTDPGTNPDPAGWRTRIVIPLADAGGQPGPTTGAAG
jgi:effector-binding domain-containing protein